MPAGIVTRQKSGPTETLDAILHAAVRAGDVAGVVAAVLTGDFAHEAAVGARTLGEAPAMAVDTIFWIASMKKPFVTAAVLQLVETGRLDLDAPIGGVLPELADIPVLDGFAPDGTPRLRPARRPVTLRHLLTHTSGFAYDNWNADIARYMEHHGLTNQRADRMLTPLVFDPGERWEYGIGVEWAGRAVERASRQPLTDYLSQHLFVPLGMADTGEHLTPDQRSRVAGLHARGPDGTLHVVPPDARSLRGSGVGGFHSTAPDYLRFLRMLLNGGQHEGTRVLGAASVAEMARNQIGRLDVPPLRTVRPAVSNDVEFLPGMRKKWGLGFMINEDDSPGGRGRGSLAWAGAVNTYFWLDPARGVAGVLLTQMRPFGDLRILQLFDRFEHAVYAR